MWREGTRVRATASVGIQRVGRDTGKQRKIAISSDLASDVDWCFVRVGHGGCRKAKQGKRRGGVKPKDEKGDFKKKV